MSTLLSRREFLQAGGGAGEASATPVPAALANAVYDAVGARITTVPFTRERVRAAII